MNHLFNKNISVQRKYLLRENGKAMFNDKN